MEKGRKYGSCEVKNSRIMFWSGKAFIYIYEPMRSRTGHDTCLASLILFKQALFIRPFHDRCRVLLKQSGIIAMRPHSVLVNTLASMHLAGPSRETVLSSYILLLRTSPAHEERRFRAHRRPSHQVRPLR